MVRVAAAAGLSILAACGPFRMGSSADDWPVVLASAQTRAMNGQFGAADSILAGYAGRHPLTHEALETTYWRALFALDPSNAGASRMLARSALDSYLQDPRPREHILEAQTLRHTAEQVDALISAAEAASSRVKDAAADLASAKAAAVDARENAKAADANASAAVADKDAEIKRLRDELAKANTELDRIRKRLASPPGKP